MNKLSKFVALLCCLGWILLASACEPLSDQPAGYPSELSAWKYADLRALDPIDAPQPEQDLIAAYWRCLPPESGLPRQIPANPHCASGKIQVRLDFLSPTSLPAYDLYLALDHQAGGTHALAGAGRSDLAWDTLIKIDSYGDHLVLDSQLNPGAPLALRVIRDNTAQVSFTFSLQELAFTQSSLGWQILVTGPGESGDILDQSEPLLSNGLPPEPVPLLLVFSQSYAADTPALALRRWDGAHTGPLGGRHGLYNLLRTARANQIPITLLDLKYPTSLAALDYGQGLQTIAEMSAAGLLSLPEIALAHSQIASTTASNPSTRQLSLEFGLPASSFLWTPEIEQTLSNSGYAKLIALSHPQLNRGRVLLYGGQRYILLPEALLDSETQPQAVLEGLDPTAIAALISAGIEANQMHRPLAEFVVLGGRLPTSTWGVPDRARAAFSYIRRHPWIQPVTLAGLQSFPAYRAALPNVAEMYDSQAGIALSAALPEQPGDRLSQDARVFLANLDSLYTCANLLEPQPAPTSTPNATNAIWQAISPVLEDWLEDLRAIPPNCMFPDSPSGASYCFFASQHTFAVVDQHSSALLGLYTAENGVFHQLAGPPLCPPGGYSPTTTTATGADSIAGLPEWMNWNSGQDYQLASFSPDTLELQSPTARIAFELEESGLAIRWDPAPPQGTALRLLPDPWNAYTPGWVDQFSIEHPEPGSLRLTTGSLKINLDTTSQVEFHSFLESQELMGSAENPNLDFPTGHYLPFSALEIIIPPDSKFTLHLSASGLP